MTAMAFQITSVSIVYSNICLGADKKNIKALCHWPLLGDFIGDQWIPPQQGPVMRKMFLFDDVKMDWLCETFSFRQTKYAMCKNPIKINVHSQNRNNASQGDQHHITYSTAV